MDKLELFVDNNYLKLKSSELVKILKEADKVYHDKGDIILTDVQYDLLKDRLKEIAPKNPYFKNIGYKPPAKLKVKLPYFMGSQNKINYGDIKELNKWTSKYNKPLEYVIGEKLDGISCLIVNDNDEIKIYNRGDGQYALDISYIKDYIKTIPSKIPNGLAVRGELLLSKKNWELVQHMGVNPRNLVAGIINRKMVDPKILSLIDFVVYDLLSERIELFDALKKVKNYGFKVVNYELIKENLNNELLFELLKTFKYNSEYEIDGIVITHNKKHELKDVKNPEYSFAFKANSLLDEAEAIVIDVIWNMSKDRYLKPVVKFHPITLNGVTIKQATGSNADYIVKNKIGKGSIVKIQRSGDVIPKIIEILKPADNGEALMPNIPYKWNKTHIDIIAEFEGINRDHDIKSITFFMKSLGIKGISSGIITKLYDNNYRTINEVINITKEQLLEIDGFKEKSAENILEAIKEIKNKSCKDFMIASNILGRGLGEKKLDLIIEKYGFICDDKERSLKLTVNDIKEIQGMGDVNANLFIENLHKFYDFMEELGIEIKIKKEETKKEIKVKNKFFDGMHFVFSGFRDKDYEEIIKNNNGIVNDTITKTTNYLIVKDTSKITEKIKKAIEKGIKVISKEEFEKNISQ